MKQAKPTIEQINDNHFIEGIGLKIKVMTTNTKVIIKQNGKIKMIIPIRIAHALGLVLVDIKENETR